MHWQESYRASVCGNQIAKRHYTCQSPDSGQFVPPGRCLVLLTSCFQSLWVTSWPFPEYVRHAWPGAWICSLFRNESTHRASVLIREAVAATRFHFGNPPALGMMTFIDRNKVRPTKVRGKEVWGWTYRKAGFVEVGETKGGLLALQLLPDAMPQPEAAGGTQLKLFA